MEERKIEDILFTALEMPEYARIEYLTKEQRASDYSELVYWRMLFDALNHYWNRIESRIAHERSLGNSVDDFGLALFTLTKGKFHGHLWKKDISMLADLLKEAGRNWGLKEQLIFITNPLHDTNENIEYIENELKNLLEADLKIKFLSYELEKTQNYIDELIKRSVQHPTLKIEGERADRLNRARVFVRFLNDTQTKIIKEEKESGKVTQIDKGQIKHWEKHNSQIFHHYQALLNQYYKDEKKFPIKDENKLIELKLNHIEPEIQKLEPLFLEKTKHGFDKIDHYGMMDVLLFAYKMFKDFLLSRQKELAILKDEENKMKPEKKSLDEWHSEIVGGLESIDIIEQYFEDYHCFIDAMVEFMKRYPDELNGFNVFENHVKRAALVITINDLRKLIESSLLSNSDEYNGKLYNIIAIKINDIEKRLTDNDFITLYNNCKSVRIDFKKSYVENMFYSPPFFLIVESLTLYNDDKLKDPKNRYGTIETFHSTILNLFNECKNRIDELFTVKKLNTSIPPVPQSELSKPEKKARKEVTPDLTLNDVFADESSYEKVMTLLVSTGYCQAESFKWIDEGKGSNAFLIAVLKDLWKKGYYKKGLKLSSEEYKIISLNTFEREMSVSTIEKAKPSGFDLSFIPQAPALN